MQIAIVGLGLIGGSMALDLKNSRFASEIIGVDSNSAHADKALALQLVDRIEPLEAALGTCDIIILAIPVQHISGLLPIILDKVRDQVVIDVGSTKEIMSVAVQGHENRGQYVATHPMAGTEFSGPQAAISGLFQKKVTIFCDADKSSPQALDLAVKLYETLGMPIIYMDSREHDLHAAYVSHISHISSFALALTVLEKEKDQENIFNLASGGFESTVRLAKSSPEMWTPIFTNNASNVINVLDTYILELQKFKNAIKSRDTDALNKLMEEANKIKRIL